MNRIIWNNLEEKRNLLISEPTMPVRSSSCDVRARALRAGMKTADTRLHPEGAVWSKMAAEPVGTRDAGDFGF